MAKRKPKPIPVQPLRHRADFQKLMTETKPKVAQALRSSRTFLGFKLKMKDVLLRWPSMEEVTE